MTKNEKKIFSEFLDDLETRMMNSSCNDFVLDDTRTNRTLLKKALKFGFKKQSDVDEFFKGSIGADETLNTQDTIIFSYLRKQLGV